MSSEDLFDLGESPTEILKNFIFGEEGNSDLKVIDKLLKEGADPNVQNSDYERGQTILHRGLDLTGQGKDKRPVLSNSQCVRLIEMISEKGSLETRDSKNRQPIHYAVERLINGHTSLDASSHSGEDVVKALLPTTVIVKSKGSRKGRSSVRRAPINVHDTNNITPLYLAIEANNIDVAKLLIAHNASPKSDRGPLLLTAVGKNNFEMIQLLLENGADPNSITELGETIDDEYQESPLSLAVTNKNIEIVHLLLRYGGLPYFKHAEGQTIRYLTSWCSISQSVRVEGTNYTIHSVGKPSKTDFLGTATINFREDDERTTMDNISIIDDTLLYPIDKRSPKTYILSPNGQGGLVTSTNSFATIKSNQGNTLISHACNLGRIDIAILLLTHVNLLIAKWKTPFLLVDMGRGADPYIRWACNTVSRDTVDTLIEVFHSKMLVKGNVGVPKLSYGPAQLNTSERVQEVKDRLGSSRVKTEVVRIQKLIRGVQGRKRTQKHRAKVRREERKKHTKTRAKKEDIERPAEPAGPRRSSRRRSAPVKYTA